MMNNSVSVFEDVVLVKGDKQKHIDFIKRQSSILVSYATWYYENFLNLFDEETHLTLVLEKNNKPIAFSSFILAHPVADVDLTVTKAEFQNLGYGSYIFESAIKILREKGFKSIVLEVAESNLGAKIFYKKLGFKRQERTLKHYYNDGQDAHIYLLNL